MPVKVGKEDARTTTACTNTTVSQPNPLVESEGKNITKDSTSNLTQSGVNGLVGGKAQNENGVSFCERPKIVFSIFDTKEKLGSLNPAKFNPLQI